MLVPPLSHSSFLRVYEYSQDQFCPLFYQTTNERGSFQSWSGISGPPQGRIWGLIIPLELYMSCCWLQGFSVVLRLTVSSFYPLVLIISASVDLSVVSLSDANPLIALLLRILCAFPLRQSRHVKRCIIPYLRLMGCVLRSSLCMLCFDSIKRRGKTVPACGVLSQGLGTETGFGRMCSYWVHMNCFGLQTFGLSTNLSTVCDCLRLHPNSRDDTWDDSLFLRRNIWEAEDSICFPFNLTAV